MEERLHCACGQSLADESKSNDQWAVYPNPTICSACGKDNSPEVREHILAAATAPKKRGGRR